MSINTPQHDAISVIRLVQDIRDTVGIEIPNEITAEIDNYRKVTRKIDPPAERELQAAIRNLYDTDVSEFDDARDRLVTASTRQAAEREVDSQIVQAAAYRVSRPIFEHVIAWEAAVVERFNDAVDRFDLNVVAGDLPDLADKGSYSIVNMGRTQGNAVEQWRSAAPDLHALWSVYGRLVAERGDQLLGPTSADDYSTNAITACALGRPEHVRQVASAAEYFASAAGGSTSSKAWGQLIPFVVPALAGYALELVPIGEAVALKSQLLTAGAQPHYIR